MVLDMATATITETQTGSRRAVVRSERFMEWQRELSSSRATHGGRKRYDDSEILETSAMRQFFRQRHSSEDGKVHRPELAEERAGDEEDHVADSHQPVGTHVTQRSKLKKQEYQKRSNPEHYRKQVLQQKGNSLLRKEDTSQAELGKLRKCKQVTKPACANRHPDHPQKFPRPQQQQCHPLVTRRTERQSSQSLFISDADAEKELRFSTRNRGSGISTPILRINKGAKRAKRAAQRLVNEDPPSIPLKLPKLHLVLTRKEVQEDWIKITGHKYLGKPRKSTLIQRGLGLCTSLTCPSSIRYLSEPPEDDRG
ncbi:hypothetical protein O6H91_12G027100 [Diphasiastrum complanatum]|uniref:Uncharacterized protein n=3 Tax=Diphasiastrum complanatum TaxID=34168 RepID=A0ACC2BZY4_DIPCM|nr:hypothetical protein O6H91_12G026600 [Diphasiastrum complanatum]KAJ7535297.1 hypothetical protein O6H91_12G026600 [Diphasiastrum complanatum]KAJ7535306.1 hypothetical protein O6H91_12G027100 [Diphasiastrum complanatum]